MTEHTLPIMRPTLPEPARLLPRLNEMHRLGMYSNRGPQVVELEERLADHLGTDASRVITVSNATLGLMGALALSDEAEWFAPAWTFSATIAAALNAGKTVRLLDVRRKDWWVDGREDARGLIAVAPFGAGVDPSRIDPGRETVVDAAASLGARSGALSALPARSAVVFSLGATKVLGSGEGGVVVFGDEERARRFASWTLLGFAGARESAFLGMNARMPEITAVAAHAALDDWDREREEWAAAREIARTVEAELGLQPPPSRGADAHPYWNVVFPDAATRRAAEQSLTAAGIDSRRWWGEGCHRQPAYRELECVGQLPVTDSLGATVLGLPFSRSLSADDGRRIRDAVAPALG